MSKQEMTTKAWNRAAAEGLRALGLPRNGDTWLRVVAARKAGMTPTDAVTYAAKRTTAKAATPPSPRKVTHAPVKLSSRALEVKAGAVARDAKGRLVSRATQEALDTLAEMNTPATQPTLPLEAPAPERLGINAVLRILEELAVEPTPQARALVRAGDLR